MIYFLYGDDSFRSREKLNSIVDRFLEKHRSGSGLSVVDCADSARSFDVSNEFGSADLFSPQKLIVVKRCCESSSPTTQEQVLEYLLSHPQLNLATDTVIVFWEGIVPEKKSKLAKHLQSQVTSQKFDLLDERKLLVWIDGVMEKMNSQLTLDIKARAMLVELVGSNLARMHKELEKLTTYRESGTITEEDVEQLVNVKGEADVFATIEACSSGNAYRALELLMKSLRAGADPHYIFSMYVYQFRNLLKISEWQAHGMRNKFEIASKTKLHPFVVEKGIQAVRNISQEKLLKVYALLGRLDEQSKRGQKEIEAALEEVILTLSEKKEKTTSN